ncbi:MAG: right-handed parallel beta-helix repeat-containing protein [Nonomuraea sp.]|nr:right-handed parallel beta-helix repeat-containing protein [Nonomuraea sp.]
MVAAVVVVSPAVPAAASSTFFVAPWGSDSADGRTAGSPYRSIQRCADVMGPGDTCQIMSGTYEETVTPARSGTAEQPITYRAAPGAKVTVSGARAVRGWTKATGADVRRIAQSDPFAADSPFSRAVAAGKIYSARADLTGDVQVFRDQRMQVEAQWPYPGLDLLAPTVQRAAAGSADATIADAALTRPAGYWNGARALTSYWYVTATTTVASSAPGSVTLAVAPPCVHKIVPKETRYALSGKIGELASPGSWFYDAAGKRLYLYSDDNPNAHRVEAKARQLAFDLTGASHTTVRGLDVFAATITTGTASTGVLIDGIRGRYLSHYTDITQGRTDCGSTVTRGVADTGIVLNGTGNQVVNSDLSLSAGNGIALRGQRNAALNNVIHDVDYLGTYAAGVAVQGNGQRVLNNTIHRVGRSGVNLQWDGGLGLPASADHIAYNDISGFARLSLDTAGIYTCCASDMLGTSIDHNVVHDATPTPGAPNVFAVSGIYADNGQSSITIANNVGWGLIEGTVMLNGLGGCSCDNSVFNNTGGMTMFYVKGPGQSTGTKVYNNIGTIRGLDGATDGGMLLSNNLPAGTDPLFVDAAAHDYRLTEPSPARQAALPIPGVTDGSTDPVASLGAYQYGAPTWKAGATR